MMFGGPGSHCRTEDLNLKESAGRADKSRTEGNRHIQEVHFRVLKYMSQLPKVQRGRAGNRTDNRAKRVKTPRLPVM
jgi:hypothetical protein